MCVYIYIEVCVCVLAFSSLLSTRLSPSVIQPKADNGIYTSCLHYSLVSYILYIYQVASCLVCAEVLSICHSKYSKALIIQEFVEHDMELRLYVVNGEAKPGTAETHARD